LSYRRIRLRGSRIRRTTLPEPYQLSSLPVCCVLPATRAELRKLDPVGIVLSVLRSRIRARPAGRARQRDDRSVVLRHRYAPCSISRCAREALKAVRIRSSRVNRSSLSFIYASTFVTTPAPTVCPPSRIAKRSPSSSAIGVPSVTSRLTLSPGTTISRPSGSFTSPVTSVVRT